MESLWKRHCDATPGVSSWRLPADAMSRKGVKRSSDGFDGPGRRKAAGSGMDDHMKWRLEVSQVRFTRMISRSRPPFYWAL